MNFKETDYESLGYRYVYFIRMGTLRFVEVPEDTWHLGVWCCDDRNTADFRVIICRNDLCNKTQMNHEILSWDKGVIMNM